MGACINMKEKPKKKATGQTKQNKEKALYKSKMIDKDAENDKPTTARKTQEPPSPLRPKTKRMTRQQFIATYRVEENVGTTSRVEGPKYVSNFSDGSGQVFRVLPFAGVNPQQSEHRARAFSEICGLELLEDDESNLLIFQDYMCGPTIDCLPDPTRQNLEKFILETYDIISKFHERNIVIGNLNIFSFRHASEYDSTVHLVDLNFTMSSQKLMGHAHKSEKSMDWEAFGYMVQLVLGNEPPIFIPHKLQYMEASHFVVNQLLKGKKVPRDKFIGLDYHAPNQVVVTGYRYRLDIIKLLKMRKRRVQHREIYYPEQALSPQGRKLPQQVIHRIQTSRIFTRIETYAENIQKGSQQAFMMYNDSSDKLKKLRETFMAREKQKKMSELKEALPLIK